jgi:hypothetical protein
MLKTKKEIKDWLDTYKITRYRINDDLTVDVDGNVNLTGKDLYELPVQFNKVNGYFWCDHNYLTSLKGSPYELEGPFHCGGNNLTSLQYAPQTMEAIECSQNPIVSLKGFNSKIDKYFFHSYFIEKPIIIKEIENYYKQVNFIKYEAKLTDKELRIILGYISLEESLDADVKQDTKKIKI